MGRFNRIVVSSATSLTLRAYLRWKRRYKHLFINWTPILNFHKIDKEREWGINSINPERFRDFLSYLKENNYKTITLREYFLLKEENKLTKKHITLCFDDGYEDFYSIAAPMLREFGFTATVFVITDFIGRNNDWDFQFGGHRFRHLNYLEIEELRRDGFEIESHTCTHPDLRRLDKASLYDELIRSKEKLRSIGINASFFSYPFGLYNERVKEAVKEAGYRGAVGYYLHDKKPKRHDPYAIERIGINALDTVKTFAIKTDCNHPLFPYFYMAARALSSISLLTPLLLKKKRSKDK